MKFTQSSALTPALKQAIESLASRCLAADPQCSPVWADDDTDTVYFFSWENQVLTGALSVSLYEEAAPALLISASVDPDYRGKGIFRRLLEKAAAYAQKHYTFSEHKLPFSCYINGSCSQAIPVLDHLGAYCASREFLLSLDLKKKTAFELPAGFEAAASKDLNLLASLQEACFDYPPQSAAAYISMLSEEPSLSSYVVWYKKRAAGLFHLLLSENTVYLMGFAIHPDFRRQGLAVHALNAVRALLPEQISSLRVQVADRNPVAYHLYLTYGFCTQECVCEYHFSLPVQDS